MEFCKSVARRFSPVISPRIIVATKRQKGWYCDFIALGRRCRFEALNYGTLEAAQVYFNSRFIKLWKYTDDYFRDHYRRNY